MSGLTAPRIIFGIHSITPYRRSDKLPYGIVKVLGSANLALTAATEKLFGGSNKFAWTAEAKEINAELSVKLKQYPDFLFQLFIGAAVTTNGADSAGTISGTANVNGSSIVNASNGLAAVTVSSGNKANLKYGKYLLVATGAGTADLYSFSDIDIKRGVAASYTNDTLKLATVDISSATDDHGTTIGLSFTKVGTPAFTTGDTAEFTVAPPSTSGADIVIGASTTTLSAIGMYCVAQKRSDGSIFDMEIYNCIPNGLPVDMAEQAFSQPSLKLECFYDSAKDAVCKMKAYLPA